MRMLYELLLKIERKEEFKKDNTSQHNRLRILVIQMQIS